MSVIGKEGNFLTKFWIDMSDFIIIISSPQEGDVSNVLGIGKRGVGNDCDRPLQSGGEEV